MHDEACEFACAVKDAQKQLVRTSLRWLTTVFPRLNSAHYHCLLNVKVSINRAFKNDASNPKKKLNHFSARNNSREPP